MFQDIEFNEYIKIGDRKWIDVRSPGEFAEATIPGSINVPLFSDEERAEIGTIYKREGQEKAKQVGLKIASAKLPQLIERIHQIEKQHGEPIIFCWRGGMRSKTVATVVDLMGVPVSRLTGGYRAYRNYVKDRLQAYEEQEFPRFVVVHGMTGCGKTILLQDMKEKGYPVLDLEQLAGHKGSVFGGFGEKEVRNQRMFESLLVEELDRLQGAPFILVEAESKRIGKVNLPDFLMRAKETGLHIYMQVPLQLRVERTMQQYPMDMPDLVEKVGVALQRIEKRVVPELRQSWWSFLQDKRYEDLIASLLTDYYDPRYLHAFKQYQGPVFYVDGADIDACEKQILHHVEEQMKDLMIETPQR